MRKAFFSKFREVEGKKNSHPSANVTTVEEVRALHCTELSLPGRRRPKRRLLAASLVYALFLVLRVHRHCVTYLIRCREVSGEIFIRAMTKHPTTPGGDVLVESHSPRRRRS